MPAIRSNVIVDSDAFRANRAAHLELIAEFRALEAKVREASGRSDAKFHQRGQLPPRERVNLLLDRDAPFLELSTLCGLGMHEDDGKAERLRRRLDRRHRHDFGRALHDRGERFRHQGRRGASDGRGKGDPRAGNRAAEQTALRPAGRERRRQPVLAGRDVRARRDDLRQHGAPVSGRNPRDFDRARLLDRRRRLSDRARRLRRDGARPLQGLPRRAAAAEGRDRRNRGRRGARRRRTAHFDDGPRRTSRRGRRRCAEDRSRNSRQARMGGRVARHAPPRRRRSTTQRNCSASSRSTIASPTKFAR